ncbi:MAG TPA: hypothetical protein ENH72_07535 [Pseudomonas sabulinigri]|uniref:DUF7079 domain-containing protein n=1 Tax=marine sediment metagenome TaxID=412755 RepID=A0A0F9V2I1_9ZZZZ|nr:hypothetical protein [Halopseudomonas sabulinigri]HEC53428.1 hypothetical protein [Halopseudomonas sabulinigri]|tara:strand:- start:9819 stop:10250 length:432 start_codon:yes stop_codon:yes gene_type:complete
MDIEKRIPLWSAFSELFLDTEVSTSTHTFIARQVLASELAPELVVDILWLEVFPALCDNLRSVAGEWAGFDEQWLCERILAVADRQVAAYSPLGLVAVNQVIDVVEVEWLACCAYLPTSFSKAQRPSLRNIKGSGKRRFWQWR